MYNENEASPFWGLASYTFIIPERWVEVKGGLVDLPGFSLCNKFLLFISHKMWIAKHQFLWYIVITKQKEVSPMYHIEKSQQVQYSA